MVDVVSVSKLPRKPSYTLNDLAELVMEVHSCLHQVGDELKEHRQEVTKDLGDVRERVAKIEGRQEAIGQRVGVDENAHQQKAAWFPKPWELITGICAAAGGFVVLYKVAVIVLSALNTAILAQH